MAAPTVVHVEDLVRSEICGPEIRTVPVDNIHHTGRETGLDYKVYEVQGGQISENFQILRRMGMETLGTVHPW
jgi:hypothetical protein